jgi:hypothetical protein
MRRCIGRTASPARTPQSAVTMKAQVRAAFDTRGDVWLVLLLFAFCFLLFASELDLTV